MRTLRINNNNALAVSAEMVGAAVEGISEDAPYLVDSGWVDDMESALEELRRARSTGDLNGLVEAAGDIEKLISELLEVDGED